MGSFKEIHDRFAKSPNIDDLYSDATLSYISSGTKISSGENIVKFLLGARKDVEITESVIDQHAGHSSLTVEVGIECKFKNGPSWIVPGIDGNLIDGTIVKFPLVKTLVFQEGKIRSIRIYWDQATVLKQLGIIGSRGRAWPITDGKNQIELITKTVVPEIGPNVEQVKPVPILQPVPAVCVTSPEKDKPKPARRTYSISNDVEINTQDSPRLPRAGWQNHRQHFVLTEEADVPLKERSPVRLPRAGQAPRREFSFSNLHEAYNAEETPVRKPKTQTVFEVIDGSDETPSNATGRAKASAGVVMHGRQHDIFEEAEEETPKNTPQTPSRTRQYTETIFHDIDATPSAVPVKPSIGGGTGGRAEETIFVELAEDSQPHIQAKKSQFTRRDQQTHFTIGDEDPATPAPKIKRMSLQHFSIEGTPDPHEEEYRARALQRKEVNHFRPDTLPHFEFTDFPEDEETVLKKDNSDSMNKLLKGVMGKSWALGNDSPAVPRESIRIGTMKKGLTPHFSFAPEEEEEKENGQEGKNRAKAMRVAAKSEEKEWWET